MTVSLSREWIITEEIYCFKYRTNYRKWDDGLMSGDIVCLRADMLMFDERGPFF